MGWKNWNLGLDGFWFVSGLDSGVVLAIAKATGTPNSKAGPIYMWTTGQSAWQSLLTDSIYRQAIVLDDDTVLAVTADKELHRLDYTDGVLEPPVAIAKYIGYVAVGTALVYAIEKSDWGHNGTIKAVDIPTLLNAHAGDGNGPGFWSIDPWGTRQIANLAIDVSGTDDAVWGINGLPDTTINRLFRLYRDLPPVEVPGVRLSMLSCGSDGFQVACVYDEPGELYTRSGAGDTFRPVPGLSGTYSCVAAVQKNEYWVVDSSRGEIFRVTED